LSKTIR